MSYPTRKFLSEVDLLSNLPADVLDDLVQRGATMTTPPGAGVIEQGSAGSGLQIVLDGSAEVSVNGVAKASLGPGAYFGEISLIDGAPRSATVVAGPDGLTTFAVSSLAFAPVIAENAAVAKTLLKALCARLRALESDETTC